LTKGRKAISQENKKNEKGSQPVIANGSDVDSVHVKLTNIKNT
jgi:hypothetical protein